MRRLLAPALVLALLAALISGGPVLAMPYVTQTVGIYDTLYQNLTTQQCRSCHGTNTADIHMASPLGCAECHPDPLAPVDDCLACHGQEEARYASGSVRRGHHVTYYAGVGECPNCHGAVVSDYGAVPPPQEPLASNAPCPENCRTCHKATRQLSPPVVGMDGADARNLHHGPQGDVVTALKCDYCHDPALTHYDQNQIRVCERCHPEGLLHELHPGELCLGCHTQLTRLVYINEVWTADSGGTRTSRFTAGQQVQFHVNYDLVGDAIIYPVKVVLKVFGRETSVLQKNRPGRGYEAVLTRTVPAKLLPGTVRKATFILRQKQAGVVIAKDRAVCELTVVSP